MRTAFFGLHVATSGLHTARKNLNVTSHNIANAEIPGFSRQVAQMQAARPLQGTGRGMYGTGSQVTGVIQMRDRFLDRKFWHQNSIQGQFSAVNTHLGFIETVFSPLPPSGSQSQASGVLKTFHDFFSSLQNLTTRAHEPNFRTGVTTFADSLAEQIRQDAFALQRQQSDLNRELADVVHTINSLGRQISELNNQIHIFERNGDNANDLRDQRALLIDRLSELVNVQVDERDFSRPGVSYDRRITVMINGFDFVNHTQINALELVARDNLDDDRSGTRRNEMDVNGLYDIFFGPTDTRFDIYSPSLSGKLRGIIDVRDGNGGQITASPILTGQLMIQTQLNALARTGIFLNNLGDPVTGQLVALNAGLPTWIADRDAALLALGGATNSTQAQAYLRNLQNLQATRDNLMRNAITGARLGGFRATIEGVINLNATSPSAETVAVRTALADLETLLNSVPGTPPFDHENFDTTAFGTSLTAALNTLHAALSDHDSFTTPTNHRILNDITSRIAAVPATVTALDDAIAGLVTGPVPDDIDAQLDAAGAAWANLTVAMDGISQVTNFANAVTAQLDWTISNAEIMVSSINARIEELEANRIFNEAQRYRDFLVILEAEITNMRDMRADIEFPPNSGVYASAADLTDLLAALDAVVNVMGNDFQDSIDTIIAAANSPAFPNGTSVTHGTTTTFKGIPFYMNQLNELVRTFARAMNEGRNRDGILITGAKGHMFGFDANGENRNALFFTFTQDTSGNPATMVADDPFQSLRLWLLADPADPSGETPLRDPITGQFVTVHDPNPPLNTTPPVARDKDGNPLFTLDYSQFNALNFIVNPELISDPRLLAASSNDNIGQANNDIIHGFLAVNNDKHLFREGRLMDFIIATNNHLAVDNSQAGLFRLSYEEITMQTHNHRLSVSSVDTEEEMLNIVRFQNMFIATSKIINVIDSVYDTLINRLGNF